MLDLTPRELNAQERQTLLEANSNSVLTFKLLDNFTKDKLFPIRIGSVNVLLYAQEHQKGDLLAPALYHFIASDLTKNVIVEYFDPELTQNAGQPPLVGPILKSCWKNSGLPISLKMQEFEARAAEKPVSVIDIANKPEYMLNYWAQSWVPLIATSGLIQLGIIQDPITASICGSAALANLGVYARNRYDEFKSKKGFFDKEMIHPEEKWLYDTEDARRVYVAAGLKLLAAEYQLPEREDQDQLPQIVMPAPIAHARRYANYLLDPSDLDKAQRKVKQVMYRGYPGLDFAVRTYQWKDMLARLSGNSDLAGWRQTSNRPINIFS